MMCNVPCCSGSRSVSRRRWLLTLSESCLNIAKTHQRKELDHASFKSTARRRTISSLRWFEVTLCVTDCTLYFVCYTLCMSLSFICCGAWWLTSQCFSDISYFALDINFQFLAHDSIYAEHAVCYCRPSVCHWWISQKWLNLGSCNFHHRVAQSLWFLLYEFNPDILTCSPWARASDKGWVCRYL